MSGVGKQDFIIIEGANEHNLKNISVNIPLTKSTCVIGPSGCGKSSLVYDTIYAESQRHLLEFTSSVYGQKIMDKPNVRNIQHLRTALNISQKFYNVNPRSTVGTVTDISYYLRSLYSLIWNFEHKTTYSEGDFSYNNPKTWCPKCKGLGKTESIQERLVVPNEHLKLSEGAIKWYAGDSSSLPVALLEAICADFKIPIETKFCDLTKEQKYILLYRTEERTYTVKYKTPQKKVRNRKHSTRGALVEIQEKYKQLEKPSIRKEIEPFLAEGICDLCQGAKLNDTIADVLIGGKNISAVESIELPELMDWINEISSSYKHSVIGDMVAYLCNTIGERIQHIISLCLPYISLGRSVPSLSGGEMQRVRLARQLSCALDGVLYILDEPCKGLHPKDIKHVVNIVKNLTTRNNTVISIEHNDEYIASADWIIEMGPGGGPAGGEILGEYKPKREAESTYSFNDKSSFGETLIFEDIIYHNLQHINVQIPLNEITCITGLSGTGKSSLLRVIYDSVSQQKAIYSKLYKGGQNVGRIEYVEQSPIGKTSKSTVITYLDIYDKVRNLFASTEQAAKAGLSASDFSMNTPGGRCEFCEGTGWKKVDLQYVPVNLVVCPECHGKRFTDNILEVKYKDYSISDVLDHSIQEIKDIFKDERAIYSSLLNMEALGLGYLKLGQLTMNLSGGESKRLKLAKALGKLGRKHILFLIDEPTAGLSKSDIQKVSSVLKQLKEQGHTIVLVDHNVGFIAHVSDYMVDMGKIPGNGRESSVIEGSPYYVYNHPDSSWS